MIEVKNVSLILKKNSILNDISLCFESGKIHGIIGRNGSGKTMLLKCICGYIQVTSGEIRIKGKTLGKDMDFPEDMGIIIETPGFIPYCSGYKNLKMLARLKNNITKKEIIEAMEMVGLDPYSRRLVKKYSLGMRQRLGLAQAIMEKPELLILDEPFNGLDKEGVADMRRYLLELRGQGKTILITSHTQEDIEILCDTVVEMEHGVVSNMENALQK